MIKNKLASHLIVTAVVFCAAYLVVINIPAVQALEMSVHGWGWVALIAGIIALRCGIPALSRKAFAVKWAFSDGAKFFGTVLAYLSYAIAFMLVAAILPTLLSYSNAVGMILLAGITGAAAATCDWLNNRGF